MLLVGGVAGLSGGGLSAPGASSQSQSVDVYWLSGVIMNDRACVGEQGLHGSDAYDLIADDSAPYGCWDHDVEADVSLRTLGYSSTSHATLGAHILSAEQPYPYLCDYIIAETVQNPSGELRGTYRYLHARGDSDYWIDIWAGPDLPRTDVPIGSTTEDLNCYGGWTGYYTHQDADSPYSEPNDPEVLVANDDIPVWDTNYYIHKWTYPEAPGTPTITSVQAYSST